VSGLKDIEVMRALQWLSNKEIIKIDSIKEKVIVLDDNGKFAKEKGFPEKQVIDYLKKKKSAPMSELKNQFGEVIGFSIGILKKRMAIETTKDKELVIKITSAGEKLFDKETLEEKFLKNEFPLKEADLKPEEKFAFDNLKSRKAFLKIETKTIHNLSKTKLLDKLLKEKLLDKELIEKLTPEVIDSGLWKEQQFRPYDIHADVPLIHGGRIHFVNEAIDHIKRIWLELGFEEMQGTNVQSAFWDLDALFVPQDHPAREMQDTFYLDVDEAKLPKEFFDKVKEMHETGDEDSKGWRYEFSEKISKKVLLRTHTTVLSARHISQLKKGDLPKKFFKVGKVYRNEALDWKHLFQFYQVEGIVVDKNANFRHLLGYLKEFYTKLGYSKIRLRPAYFPYTEPSVEVEYFNEKKKEWVELGGAGMIRPEVTKMLFGEEIPVLAWGQGMERGICQYFGINDLRDIYNNDFKNIKNMIDFIQL
jgi:phenylalanyl-tRNA synthetase alpha chain